MAEHLTQKFCVKTINIELLTEQIGNVVSGPISVRFLGFTLNLTNRYWRDPFASGRIVNPGTQNERWVEPGELELISSEELTIQELTNIDTVLTNHLYTDLTEEQEAKVQDNTDKQQLVYAYQNWATLNTTEQRQAIKLLLRLLLRRELDSFIG